MPRRPCLDCGTLTEGSRCPTHRRTRERNRPRPGPRQRGLDHQYQTNRATLLAISDLCWLCGHHGADQADHVIPIADGGTSDITNLRPSHGTRPCPTCGIRCNQHRGTTPVTHSDGDK